jgi:AcrB/AcrD/AcrF family
MDVGGRTVEVSETEYALRGRGYVKSLSDLEQIVVKSDKGVPVLLKDVARVELTPDERRGITELNGEGEVVSGIALQRFGENALSVIQHVKDPLRRSRAEPAQGRNRGGGVRPLGLDQPRHRYLEADPVRGERHCGAGLRHLPAARPQRARCHHYAAAWRADRLYLCGCWA